MALSLDLNVGTPRPFTTSGVPAPDGVLKTENGRFLITQNGNFLEFEVSPFLSTEADEVLRTELNEAILT
jgi:hypothetical protein